MSSQWEVYCVTESAFVKTWSGSKPTVCPNDSGHTIRGIIKISKGKIGKNIRYDQSSNITGIETLAAGGNAVSGYKTTIVGSSGQCGLIVKSAGNSGTTPLRITNYDESEKYLYIDAENSRLGIHMENPTEALDVSGNAHIRGNITLSGTVDGRDISSDGTTLDSHVADTTSHGATGAVVGTTNTQILTNKTINTANNTLTISANDITSGTLSDARISESSVTQHQAALNHDNLNGFVAEEHIDWTSDQGATNIHQNNVTESSVTQHESALNHDNLAGFISSEHVDHSSVSITAGEGLSGGGTIAATRTIDLDIPSLTTDSSPDGSSDYVVTYDNSSSSHKKVLLDNLPGGGSSVFGTEYHYEESLELSGTSSSSYVKKLVMETSSLPAGDYRVAVSYNWLQTSTGSDFRAQLLLDSETEIYFHQQEPKDSGKDQSHTASGFTKVTLSSGTHTINLNYSEQSGNSAYISNARVELWRVS